jgi:hypothetical protein
VVQKRARGWFSVPGALSLVAGLAVLAGLVWKVGLDQILGGFSRVGWAFPAIVALGGLRFLVRAWAWSLCIEPPHRLGVGQALAAVLAGDALGNVTPLGPVVGEPAKVAFARTHVPATAGATALAIENLFYTLSTALMIAAGTLALLFTVNLPAPLRDYSELAIVGIAVAVVSLALVFRWRPAVISRWLPLLAIPGTRLHVSREKLHTIEQDVYSFASRRRGTLVPVAALELAFHALGVIETHLTMWMLIGPQASLVTSFVIETASRLITVLFKVVPFQLGFAQGGLAVVTGLLGFGEGPGVTFSLVRVARQAVWALVGAGLLVRRGITPSLVLADQDLRANTR